MSHDCHKGQSVSPVNDSSVFSRIGFTPSPYKWMSSSKRKLNESFEDSNEDKCTKYSVEAVSPKSTPTLNGSLNESLDAERWSAIHYNRSPTTSPCGRDNKVGWYDIHDRHVALTTRSHASLVLCGDSIIAGLTRYKNVWNKYFRPFNALNFGIGGDRTQHVLWRAENLTLPSTVQFAVIHCGTNNIDSDTPEDIANGVLSVGLVLMERKSDLKIIATGLLPRDFDFTYRRSKILLTNKYIKQICRKFNNFYYMKHDSDWTSDDGQLSTQYYYTDYLHLIEAGNEKFAASITSMIRKIKDGDIVCSDESENEISFQFEKQISEARPRKKLKSLGDEFSRKRKSDKHLKRSSKIDLSNDSNARKRKRDTSPGNNVRMRKRCSSPDSESSLTQNYLNLSEGKVDLKKDNFSDSITLSNEKLKQFDSDDNLYEIDYSNTTSTLNNGSFTDSNSSPLIYAAKEKQSRNKRSKFQDEDNEIQSVIIHKPELSTVNPSAATENADILLKGTVKSIDISLADSQRLQARKAKFGTADGEVGSSLKKISDLSKASIRDKPRGTSTPSALVLKIRRSMAQAREELNKKKMKVSVVGSPLTNPSFENKLDASTPRMRKLLSEYGSGSDSE